MKPISKSKRQLAQLLIEAGVKQFPDGGNYATQDASGLIYCYVGKPFWVASNKYWSGESVALMANADAIVHNHHQTFLTSAEFDQIVAESAEQSKPDADGWIEWQGGECPVELDELVQVRFRENDCSGAVSPVAGELYWKHCGHGSDIIAYRLHKPEQVEPQYCESVTRAIPELVTAPTLDQLLQDYRNASDFAADKQAEADEAAKMRDERWRAAQARACELGVHISVELVVDAEMRESEPVITDWRDLRVGDLVEVVVPNGGMVKAGENGVIVKLDVDGFRSDFPSQDFYWYRDRHFERGDVKFTRRP